MLAVLIAGAAAGLVSAPHCALMCGPIATYSSKATAKGGTRYHLGRTAGYSAAGALAGLLGQPLVHRLWDSDLSTALSWSLALIMAIAAYRAWPRRRAQEPDTLVQLGSRKTVAAPDSGKRSSLLRLLRHGAERPALLGVLSVFIPCAALWSGLVIAASAGSASAGAIAMVAFSLTSGTGLLATGFLTGRLRTRPRHHRILSLVFAAGALILVLRPIGMQQASASSDETHEVAPAHCPLHAGGLP